MAGEAYQRFLDSMIMNFDRWHDGTGYDLEALEQLGPPERAAIEQVLIRHLREAGDWRDLEALVALGTNPALEAVDQARFHNNAKVRNYAIRTIIHIRNSEEMTKKEIAEFEQQVIQAVEQGNYEMAESMPTVRVKQALLHSIREADRVTRVNAAVFLLYLCGQAPEPFDWSQRPFFLRFGEDNPEELREAWEELRERTGL